MATIRKRQWTNAAGDVKTAWQVDYLDQTGKRCAKQFKTRKAADGYLVGARYEVRQGTHTAPSASATVAEAVKAWLDHSEAEGLDAQTIRTYRCTAAYHVTPILGHVRLAQLTRPAIEQ